MSRSKYSPGMATQSSFFKNLMSGEASYLNDIRRTKLSTTQDNIKQNGNRLYELSNIKPKKNSKAVGKISLQNSNRRVIIQKPNSVYGSRVKSDRTLDSETNIVDK